MKSKNRIVTLKNKKTNKFYRTKIIVTQKKEKIYIVTEILPIL